jgi:hypothetical protein
MEERKNAHIILAWKPLGRVHFEKRKGNGRIIAKGVVFC